MRNSDLMLGSDFLKIIFGCSNDILNVAGVPPAMRIAHTPELTRVRSHVKTVNGSKRGVWAKISSAYHRLPV